MARLERRREFLVQQEVFEMRGNQEEFDQEGKLLQDVEEGYLTWKWARLYRGSPKMLEL